MPRRRVTVDPRFPLAAKSQAMQQLLAEVRDCERQRYAAVIRIGTNYRELDALVAAVITPKMGFPLERVTLCDDPRPQLELDYRFDPWRGIALTQGDHIPADFQAAFVDPLHLSNIRLLILFTQEPLTTLSQSGNPAFWRDSREIVWPSPSERMADAGLLVRRISSEVPGFELGDGGLYALMQLPGVDNMFNVLSYCTEGRGPKDKPLTLCGIDILGAFEELEQLQAPPASSSRLSA